MGMGTSRGLMAWAVAWGVAVGAGSASAATGPEVPELVSYDTQIQAYMQRWNIPGAAVAVTRNGRLVLARGYGVTDVGGSIPVQPDSLFRIASVSKPITSMAVMKLVEDGALSLDLPVFPYLARGTPSDARLNAITVRHLLEHTGGWDRDLAGDPMFDARRIAAAMGVPSPPSIDTTLRYMLTQPLQFAPGSRYAYSNFGYLVLGEVIAKASGQTHEDYVRTLMLKAGVTRARLGATLPAGRLPGEVGYAMPGGTPLAASVFDSAPGPVPWPYGGFALEPTAAHGGWVASAMDLVALASLIDRNTFRPDLLSSASITEMRRVPAYAAAGAQSWYAKGWLVNTAGNIWHDGSLPGTTTLMVSAANGTQWAVLLNSRDETRIGEQALDLDNTMWAAYGDVTRWPADDRFAALHGSGPVEGCYGHAAYALGVLCIPAVDVPAAGGASARYTAVLSLTDAAAFEFTLTSAIPALSGGASVTAYDPATGTVTLPRVLLPQPGGVPLAYRAELALVPGAGPLRFRLKSAAPL